jgi:hypothetical protein
MGMGRGRRREGSIGLMLDGDMTYIGRHTRYASLMQCIYRLSVLSQGMPFIKRPSLRNFSWECLKRDQFIVYKGNIYLKRNTCSILLYIYVLRIKNLKPCETDFHSFKK